MTVRPQSQSLVRVAGFVRARRGSARPSMRTPRCLHLPSGAASGGVRQGQQGRQRSRARRLMAEVSAHRRLFGVRADVFRSAKRSLRSGAVGKWPLSRLMPMSWPGEASRPFDFLRVAHARSRLSRQFVAVGMQWSGNVACEIETEWSGAGAKLVSQAVRGQTVPVLGGASRTGEVAQGSARCGRVSLRPPTFCRSRGAIAPRCPDESR